MDKLDGECYKLKYPNVTGLLCGKNPTWAKGLPRRRPGDGKLQACQSGGVAVGNRHPDVSKSQALMAPHTSLPCAKWTLPLDRNVKGNLWPLLLLEKESWYRLGGGTLILAECQGTELKHTRHVCYVRELRRRTLGLDHRYG